MNICKCNNRREIGHTEFKYTTQEMGDGEQKDYKLEKNSEMT